MHMHKSQMTRAHAYTIVNVADVKILIELSQHFWYDTIDDDADANVGDASDSDDDEEKISPFSKSYTF